MIWTGWTLVGGFLRSRAGLMLLAAVLALALVWAAYAWAYDRGHDAGSAEVQAQFDDYKAQAAEDAATARSEARAKESEHRAALVAVAAQYEKEKADALAAQVRVADDLRSGALRLRRQWQGCESAAARVPATAGAAPVADGDAELRSRGAGDLVGIGARADAQVRGLQAALAICTGSAQ